MTAIRYPLVRVTWKDPSGPTEAWTPVEELGGPDALHTVVSVGFLTKDGNVLVIVPHIADDSEGFGEISIPKGVVLSVEELRPAA